MGAVIPKLLTVTVLTATGAGVPLAVSGNSVDEIELRGEAINSDYRVGNGIFLDGQEINLEDKDPWIDGWVLKESILSPAERRNNDALQELDNKKCRQIKNPAFSNSWFGALWICKLGEKDKDSGYFSTEFYFLDKDRSKDWNSLYLGKNLDSLLKKVVSLSYSEGSLSDSEKIEGTVTTKGGAHITLGFQRGEKQKLEVPLESIWKNFKGENPSDSCKVGTMAIGGDLLWCKLSGTSEYQNSEGKAHYYFSVT